MSENFNIPLNGGAEEPPVSGELSLEDYTEIHGDVEAELSDKEDRLRDIIGILEQKGDDIENDPAVSYAAGQIDALRGVIAALKARQELHEAERGGFSLEDITGHSV